MRSSGPLPIHRSSPGSKDSDLLTRISYYSRSDQPCMLPFRVDDIVWARSNGRWAFGVVVSSHDLLRNQNETQLIPTYTVLTRGGSPYELTLVALSPLFGSLKPANTYVAALLRAEGVFPLSGTDHADILDLQIKAHAWIDRRGSQLRMQNVVS